MGSRLGPTAGKWRGPLLLPGTTTQTLIAMRWVSRAISKTSGFTRPPLGVLTKTLGHGAVDCIDVVFGASYLQYRHDPES